MEFELNEVVCFLNDNKINYSMVNDSEIDLKYRLSSIKKKIEKGLYFLTSEFINESIDISNSVIFTNSCEIIKNTNIYLVVENPQLVHYKLASSIKKEIKNLIHESAIVDQEAEIHSTAYIGPFCIIGKSIIGENVQLLHHVTVEDNVVIMKNTVIEGNSTIGARGMAWIWDENGERVMQPQLGGVIIEENCVLGTDITIVRGSLNEDTKIGKGTIIAHGTKIGHGCTIKENVHFANNVSLAGNAHIGNRVFLGSACVISSNVKVCEGTIVAAGAVVIKTFNQKNCTLAGVPARIIKTDNFVSKPNGVPKPFKE
jgi:UDP-3-O-[3-hydroxymyristoyl] glucosamine N-acyltransferase